MIETQEAFTVAIERALGCPYVALDTEFLWERTYYPKLALVQIGYPNDDVVLIDPFLVPDLSPLRSLLESADTVKILHSADHDLSILCRTTGAQPKTIFDTQVAAGFVGMRSSLSLVKLLENLLQVRLTKAERRSDWIQRPLTDAQIGYARRDVLYLIPAMLELQHRADDAGKAEWVREEMARLDHPSRYEPGDPSTYYLRISTGRNFSLRKLTVLQHLAMWRESTAQQRDVPRSRILSDKELIQVVQRMPRNERAISSMRRLNSESRRKHGRAILEAVRTGSAADLCPEPPPTASPDRAESARVLLLEAYVAGTGLAHGIDPQLITNRSEITRFVMQPMDSSLRLRQGWRWTFVGNELTEILAGVWSVTINPKTGLPGSAPGSLPQVRGQERYGTFPG